MSHIKQFDRPDTLVVITSYPISDVSKGYSAIDRYSQHKIADIAKKRPVVVCAQKELIRQAGAKKNIWIQRIWQKASLQSLLDTYRFIMSLTHVKTVLIEFEFNVFGGTLANLMMLFVTAMLTLHGKRVVIELHQVVTNIDQLKIHLNIKSFLATHFYSLGLKLYYIALGIATSHIIVLEEALKKRLSAYVRAEKITALPHHMDIQRPINKVDAKKALGVPENEFTVLVFGYINHYKGVDWIVRASRLWKGHNVRLLIAGGQNPYHVKKAYYKKYFNRFLKHVKSHAHITYTGFVPEQEIQKYFSACDLVVLPYRIFMSASGPYSLALSYGKPAILSDKLKGYHESPDFLDALENAKLTEGDVFFHMETLSLFEKIQALKNSKKLLKKLTLFSKNLAQKRSFAHTQKTLSEILFLPQASVFPNQIFEWYATLAK